MMIAPCKDCTRREVGCHGKCEDYGKWNEEHARLKKKEADARKYGRISSAYISEAIRRMKK